MNSPDIIFPFLGINIENMSSGFDIFGLHIAWYGVIIACGMVVAAIIIYNLARRTGQNADDYIDIAILTVIFGIIGARLYYVVFNWDYYMANPGEIINLRNGGLAIYGGIIFGVACIAIVCKVKKISFLRVIDTCAPGVVLAQAIGRWGNFTNMEAYGGFSHNFLSMQIKLSEAKGVVSDELMSKLVTVNGEQYIQVHPTFLYESALCVVIFILIMIFRKKARYYGEVALWYFGGYGLGRFFIEGLRTDSLYLWGTDIAVSQLLAFLVFFASLAVLIVMRIFIHREPEKYGRVHQTVPGWRELKFEKKKKKKNEDDAASEHDQGDGSAEEPVDAGEEGSPDAGADGDDNAPAEADTVAQEEQTEPEPKDAGADAETDINIEEKI